MVRLLDGEKNLKVSLFVWTECMNVTNRRTVGHRMTAKATLA